MRLLRYINSAARLHQQAQNALKSIPDRSQTQAPRQLAPTPPPPAQNEPDTPQLSDTQRVKPSEPPRGTSEPRPVPPARPPLNRRQRRALLKMR
jgi:hypothetical protein